MSNEFEITVCSDTDYEDLIAEIYFRGDFVALISQESGFDALDIQIHPRKDGKPWEFNLKEFEAVVERARQRLWELRKIPVENEGPASMP